MHRVILLKIGGKRLHLLKIAGALVLSGAALGVLATVAEVFRIIKQVELSKSNAALALEAFNLPSSALSNDVVLGLLMQPIAFFMLWLALFVAGAMVYRSGNLVLPIEEEEETERR
jgi:hypothetical protein